MPVEERGLVLPGSSESRKYIQAYSLMLPPWLLDLPFVFALHSWLLLGLDSFGWLSSTFPHFFCSYITASPLSESIRTNWGGEGEEFCRFWGHTSVFCLIRFEAEGLEIWLTYNSQRVWEEKFTDPGVKNTDNYVATMPGLWLLQCVTLTHFHSVPTTLFWVLKAWSAMQSIAQDKPYPGMCVEKWLNWQSVLRWKGQPNDTVSMHFP